MRCKLIIEMSIFGSVPVFDCKSDEWVVHKAQLSNFFLANGISDTSDTSGAKRRAIFLNCMSQDSYRLTRDLLYPLTPEETSYINIVKTLDTHFQPKKCIYAERQKFYSANKETHESLAEYAARLKGLASDCSFGSALEMCLTDRFVLGVDSPAVREKLFREKADQLNLSTALELACAVESARRVLVGSETYPGGAAAVKPEPLLYAAAGRSGGRASAPGLRAPPAQCAVCGGRSHAPVDCGYRHLNCDNCGVKGHLKKMCTSKGLPQKSHIKSSNKKNNKNWRNYYMRDFSDDEDYNNCTPFNNIRCLSDKPMAVEVSVYGISFSMEVDSGSAVSAMPANVWRNHFSHLPLGESNKYLRTYSGSVLTPVGMCTLPVLYNEVTHFIDFYVIENGPVSLLGRDFLSKFKLAFMALNYCATNIDGKSVLAKYGSLFSGDLGTFNKYKLTLHLKEGSTPKFFKARTVPFALKDKVSAELDRLVSVGILKPVTYSRYASPIVAVLKKNNDVRLCGDYSVSINKDLKVDSYPLPKMSDLCASLHNARYFSKLDLSNSYNQFLLDEQSQEYTCINTHKGLFVYTRLVFGLANAPALFQRAMVQLLQGIQGVEVFIDDVLIAAPTRQLHWDRVDQVLKRLSDAGLMLQQSKCSFCQDRVEYLGFVIDREGIHKNPDKIKSITELNIPQNVKQLKSFLGLINFYRHFIPNAAMLLEPLHKLLRKDSEWSWSDEQQKAFDSVKTELSSSRILAHFDPRQTLVLTVDAAPGGLGAVLAVRYNNGSERPLCYASRALNKSERSYSQIQKEATAIIYGIKKYHQYLYGRAEPFILRTDHKPLLSIFSPDKGIPQMTESRLQRYAIFLAAYNYRIEFVNSENNVADYLSRFPVDAEPEIGEGEEPVSYVNALVATGAPFPASLSELQEATANDATLSAVLGHVAKGWPKKVRTELLPYRRCQHELHVDKDCLMRGHRIVVPEKFRAGVLQELHAAHLGVVKMKLLARERCWYPNIDNDIERVVANCTRCVATRPSPPRIPIEPWEWPRKVFERIHLDFLGPFHGTTYLVLIDAHSKWLECVEVPNLMTQTLINKLKNIFSHFGYPKYIVTDNAKTFIASEFTQFCAAHGVKHILSPVYFPQSNGLAENAVKTCKKFLTNALKDGPVKNVTINLDHYLFHYRNTPHCTTGVSPASLMFGRSLNSKLDLVSGPKDSLTQSGSSVLNRVKSNQDRQKKSYGGQPRGFCVNDRVWTKDYRGNPAKPQWILGVIKSRVGRVLYDITIENTQIVWRRHANQIVNANSFNCNNDLLPWTYQDYGTDAAQSTEPTNTATAAPVTANQATTPASPGASPARSPGAAADEEADDTFSTPPSISKTISAPPPQGERRTRSGRCLIPYKLYKI